MSTNVIALLYAFADTSGIPPGVPSEFEIECTPTDLVEAEAIVEDTAQENSTADQPTPGSSP